MKVAVLCGGRSHERAVSLRSGARVEEAVRELGHEVELLDVGRDASRLLRDGNFDVAFNALHGAGGEDGTIQSLLELLGIPYTGARSGPSEAAFDKARAKRLLRAAGVRTPEFLTLSERALEEFGAADALDEARNAIGFPLVVKPARGGSSLGVRFVDGPGDLPRALIGAMSYDRTVLVERHVTGRELSVALLVDPSSEGPRALPAVEIVPRHADWFDYESRYGHGETEFTCPPTGFDDGVLDAVRDAALATWHALDVSGCARVDLLVDDAGTPWVLELSPVPGLTDTSTFPLACAAAGLELADVVQLLIDDALRVADDDR